MAYLVEQNKDSAVRVGGMQRLLVNVIECLDLGIPVLLKAEPKLGPCGQCMLSSLRLIKTKK
jgi:hypothetical protein